MLKITDRKDWFELFCMDKESLLKTMSRNIADDLKAGYDFFGKSIQMDIKEMEAYQDKYHAELDLFKTMDEKQVNRYCFYDMKKRGVIA